MALAPERPSLRARRPAVGGREVTDTALVAAAVAGDESALTAIHERYRAPLERYCRTIVLHHADAEDAAQAALAAGLRALADRRAEPESLRAWLYKIAHREALAVLRRRPPAGVGDPSDDALAALLPSAPDGVAARDDLRGLLDDLRALPERQRCALVLHELGGLRHEEIADALGLASDGAARQAVHAARTAMRRRRTADLHVLFPTGPVVALAAGAGGVGAGAAGLAAAGGAGGLGALGAWITGAGVATKCAAVCAAIGAIGAGSLAAVEAPRIVGEDRPAPRSAPAPERSDRAPSRPATSAPATTGVASTPAVVEDAAARIERRAERTAAAKRAERRRARAEAREERRRRAAREREEAAATAPAADAPAPDVVGIDVSGDAGDVQAPTPAAPTPAASTPAPSAPASPPATRRASNVNADVVVTDSDIGGLVDETGAAVTDVVVDAG